LPGIAATSCRVNLQPLLANRPDYGKLNVVRK
jgi:hypothetical protein